MNKFLVLLCLLLPVQVNGQIFAADLLKDFEEGVHAVETNYAGYTDKATARTHPAYASIKDSLRIVLDLRSVNDRVRVFGKDHSMGCHDYMNPFPFILPKTRYRFSIPVCRHRGLPESGMDGVGIVPDVMIDSPYPSSLTDNVDEWTLWVADWFASH